MQRCVSHTISGIDISPILKQLIITNILIFNVDKLIFILLILIVSFFHIFKIGTIDELGQGSKYKAKNYNSI